MVSIKQNNSKIENIEIFSKDLEERGLSSGKKRMLYALLAIIMGLVIGMILLAILGKDPFAFLGALFKGSFGDLSSFGSFLANFSWLLLVGLAVGVALKLGMFNIGVTSQFMLGGITGFFWAYFVNIGRFGVVFSIFIPLITGALLGMLIGYLKAKHGVHEVLTSIMFNWIVYYLYKYLTVDWSYTIDGGGTQQILDSNSLKSPWLSEIFGQFSLINIGLFVAIAALVFVWFLLKKTQWGKQVEITGSNKDAAVYAGFKKDQNIIKVMAISGALAGLAGSVYYLGISNSLNSIGNDLPGEAFNGIAVALIGFSNPFGMVFSALFMSTLTTSSELIQGVSGGIPREIVDLVNGIIIWFIAIVNYFIIYDPIHKLIVKSKNKNNENFEKYKKRYNYIKINENKSYKEERNKSADRILNSSSKGGKE